MNPEALGDPFETRQGVQPRSGQDESQVAEGMISAV